MSIGDIAKKLMPKKFAVLGVELLQEGEKITFSPYAALLCEAKKGALHIEEITIEQTLQTQLEQLAKLPVILQVDGEQIIHRIKEEGETIETTQFYVEETENESIAVVMRATLRAQLEATLLEIKNDWLAVHVGSSGQIAFLADYQGALGLYEFEEVPYFDPQPPIETHYHGEKTTTLHLPLFIRAIAFLSQGQSTIAYQSWGWKRVQQRIMKVGIPLLFALLLGNFLMYQPLYNEVASLSSTMNSAGFQNWHEQRELIQQRQKFVQSFANAVPGQLSWYADQLMLTKPNKIIMQTLSVDAIQGKARPRKAPRQNVQTIVLKGQAKSAEEVKQWMQNMDTQTWIEHCTLAQYGIRENKVDFEIIVNTKSP